MTRRTGMGARVVAAVAAIVTLGGCTLPTLSSLPAPNTVSGPMYTITGHFADALNLPIGAKVKVSGAIVGQVTRIRTKDFHAIVTMQIRKDQRLPVGTQAQIRFTTPLGELYVAMYLPATHARGFIDEGGTLGEDDTAAAPTIEDAFAALSALINGGGLDQIGVIVRELNKALHGNTAPVRDLIERLDFLVRNFNAHKDDFNHALDAMNRLAARLASGHNVIDDALTTFPPAIRVLAAETGKLNELLDHVQDLGTVTTRALSRGTAALLDDIDYARPVLASLAGVRDQLVPVMRGLVGFGNVLERSAPGDYLTAYATVTLDFTGEAILPPNDKSGAAARPVQHATAADDVVRALLGGGVR